MASNPTEISRQALLYIGAKPIQSIDEGNHRAMVCKEFYQDVKESALSEHYWNFATKQAQLSQLAQEPTSKYKYQFDMPNDRVIDGPIKAYYDEDHKRSFQSWQIINGRLMTDQKEVYIEYVADVDENKFPSYFSLYLTYKLAANIAISITDQVNMAQKAEQNAQMQLNRARIRDSQTNTTKKIEDNPLNDVRFGD